MATIADIARKSGVSTASVSYVLNDRGSVSAETRERVLQAMRDLNYRPGPLFRGKHREGSTTLGVVFMHKNVASLTDHPWITMLLDGILSVTTPLRADILLLSSLDWDDMRKTLREKCDGRCDGLLLLGLPNESTFIEVLQERGMPFVCLNFGSGLGKVSYVDVDNQSAAMEATQYLLGLGHKRIAHLSGEEEFVNSRDRARGYRLALEMAGITPPSAFMPEGGYSGKSGYERTLKLLSLPPDERPTALFCGSDRIAVGALQAARELGVSVPQELSVMGFDDVPHAASAEPSLTTVRQPIIDIGKRAAEILIGHINDRSEAGQTDTLPTQIIVRNSTGPFRDTPPRN